MFIYTTAKEYMTLIFEYYNTNYWQGNIQLKINKQYVRIIIDLYRRQNIILIKNSQNIGLSEIYDLHTMRVISLSMFHRDCWRYLYGRGKLTISIKHIHVVHWTHIKQPLICKIVSITSILKVLLKQYISPTGPNKYLRGITPTKTDKLKLDLF